MKLESKIKSKSPLAPLFQRGGSQPVFFLSGAAGSCTWRTMALPRTAFDFPPLKKGGRGDLLSAPTIQLIPDRLEHRLHLQQNLPIIESDDLQSHALQICRTHTVDRRAGLGRMLRSVHFNDQSDRRQIKVDDVRANRFLPITGDAIELLATKMEPEPVLGIGHVASKSACESFEGRVVFQHATSKPARRANAYASSAASNGRKMPQSDGAFQ